MTSGLPNTSDHRFDQIWEERQDALIASLQQQPLLLVVRPQQQDLDPSFGDRPLMAQLRRLHDAGLQHVEIAWIDHPGWSSFVRVLRAECAAFRLGAASVVNGAALNEVHGLGLTYAMSPVWDLALQQHARSCGQLLVPGVFSPSEVMQAKQWGSRLVKLFPAADVGRRYWGRLQAPLGDLPWVIAAGGLILEDVQPWLQAGHGAVALGRRVIGPSGLHPDLLQFLDRSTTRR